MSHIDVNILIRPEIWHLQLNTGVGKEHKTNCQGGGFKSRSRGIMYRLMSSYLTLLYIL